MAIINNGVLIKILDSDIGSDGQLHDPYLFNGVTSIGALAFNGCTGLTSLTLPNGVTSIGYLAFNGCTGLTSLTLPNSVTSIGSLTFNGCTGLETIFINTDDEAEVNRIRDILPEELHSKVAPLSLKNKIETIKEEQIIRLMQEATSSPIYMYLSLTGIPDELIEKINSELKNSHPWYLSVKEKVNAVSLPTSNEDFSRYKADVKLIIDDELEKFDLIKNLKLENKSEYMRGVSQNPNAFFKEGKIQPAIPSEELAPVMQRGLKRRHCCID